MPYAIASKLDELGRPAWIALMILGFIAWWPVGLAFLAFLIGSGRMGCWKHNYGRWRDNAERMAGGPMSGAQTWWRQPPSSGNTAFDEYRTETLRRLEEEQREFHDFLNRLREAKDKSEFDQFMADRRNRPASPPPPPSA